MVIDRYYTLRNRQRRRSVADQISPVNYEISESQQKSRVADDVLHDLGGITMR